MLILTTPRITPCTSKPAGTTLSALVSSIALKMEQIRNSTSAFSCQKQKKPPEAKKRGPMSLSGNLVQSRLDKQQQLICRNALSALKKSWQPSVTEKKAGTSYAQKKQEWIIQEKQVCLLGLANRLIDKMIIKFNEDKNPADQVNVSPACRGTIIFFALQKQALVTGAGDPEDNAQQQLPDHAQLEKTGSAATSAISMAVCSQVQVMCPAAKTSQAVAEQDNLITTCTTQFYNILVDSNADVKAILSEVADLTGNMLKYHTPDNGRYEKYPPYRF